LLEEPGQYLGASSRYCKTQGTSWGLDTATNHYPPGELLLIIAIRLTIYIFETGSQALSEFADIQIGHRLLRYEDVGSGVPKPGYNASCNKNAAEQFFFLNSYYQ
jgi:hypothetical protein